MLSVVVSPVLKVQTVECRRLNLKVSKRRWPFAPSVTVLVCAADAWRRAAGGGRRYLRT